MKLFSGKTALLIIDGQNEFLNSAVNSLAVIEVIKIVLSAARDAEIPIIFTQEMHRKEQVDFGRELDGAEAIHCLENSDDVEIVDSLRPIDGEFVITKRRYSCLFATDLDLLLRGLRVDTIIVCGFLIDVCVHYTCVDAHQYDCHIKVVNDGVDGTSLKAHQAALDAIHYLQRGSITNADQIIQTLEDGFKIQEGIAVKYDNLSKP